MLEHRFALATAFATFLLLVVGGLVHATGSSLACPDWPLCFGQVFPEMVGGVLVEHSHRLIATAVGVCTLVLAGLVFARRKDDPTLRKVAIGAIALVILQGVLGGVTVLLRLPPVVSISHLATSQLYFLTLIWMAVRTWPGRAAAAAPVAGAAPLRGRVRIATIVTFVQVVLGALVRHLGAGLACGAEFPLCQGALWPSFGAGHLQMTHRVLGFVVMGLVIWATVPVLKRARAEGARGLLRLAVAPHLLVTAQIGLGIFSVLSWLGVEAVTLHLGGGALLLANLGALWFALEPGVWRGVAATGSGEGARVLRPAGAAA